MGLFKSKVRHPLEGLTAHPLRKGGEVPLVDVEPGFVDFVRATKPKLPRLGHEVPIALVMRGNRIAAYYDDRLVGAVAERESAWFADDFAKLERRREYALTVAYIKPDGSQRPHSVTMDSGSAGFRCSIL